MPFAPGTTSIAVTSASHSSRIRATRPAAFGRAPQGTQYSIRIRWSATVAFKQSDVDVRCTSAFSLAG